MENTLTIILKSLVPESYSNVLYLGLHVFKMFFNKQIKLKQFMFRIKVDEPVDSEDGLDVVGRVPRCVKDDDAIGRD